MSLSFTTGDRVRVKGNPQVPSDFVGQFGRVTNDVRADEPESQYTLRVTFDADDTYSGRSAWFRPSELVPVVEVLLDEEGPVDKERPLIEVIRPEPEYIIDLRQFGDGDHYPIRLTQAEALMLSNALIRADV